ncbi:MAG TPA: quinone oxidoreductase [Caulobacteraceae bacterium]|nr:quinone oxidoreductase [Caulobacteraceae bacterium]
MLTIEVHAHGGPEVLQPVDRPIPEPGPGEILIRQTAIGLNFIDTYFRSGLYPAPLPFVPGGEGAGVVEAVGEGVTRFKVGDRAAYSGGLGGYAAARVYKADRAVRTPDDISDEVAAAVMLKGMTAEYLVRQCFKVQSGQTVLVQAAAGGAGGYVVQWAKALGARVIGTAGSPEKAALARQFGADEVILYRDEDIVAKVKALTAGEGVNVAYDSVGKDTIDASLASLKRRGWLVAYGNASGPAPPIDPLRLMRGGSLILTRPTSHDFTVTTADLEASAGAVFDAIRSGALRPLIAQRFALKDVAEAHRALEGRKTVGATLLIP